MQFSSYMKAAGVSEKGEVLQFNDMLSAPQQGRTYAHRAGLQKLLTSPSYVMKHIEFGTRRTVYLYSFVHTLSQVASIPALAHVMSCFNRWFG